MAWTNNQMWALINKPEPEEIVRYDLINKPEPEELMHFGIKGQKWGIRRYQNADGTLTEEGKRRYLNSDGTPNKEGQKAVRKQNSVGKELNRLAVEKQEQRVKEREEYLKKHENDKPVKRDDLLKAVRETIISGQQIKDLMKKHRVDYDEVYLEMSDDGILDLESEDNDDYKIAEAAWYLKHKDDKK